MSGALFHSAQGRVLVGWGKPTWEEAPSALHLHSLYAPDFFLSLQKPWCIFPSWQEMSIKELLSLLKGHIKTPVSLPWQGPSKGAFEASFTSLQEAFVKKTLQKGVAYQFQVAHNVDVKSMLSYCLVNLLKAVNGQKLYPYGFWNATEGMLGATPELLFQSVCAKDLEIESMACAGTQPAHRDALCLLNDKKQCLEHSFVIEGIKASIALLEGTLELKESKVVSFSTLSHLVTPLFAKLPLNTPFDAIVKALHPTPALGALPRQAGLDWLLERQKEQQRLRFGAPIALVKEGYALCLVAIRNMQWQNKSLFLGAGCGIVPESSFEAEWQELHLKLSAIKQTLGLF